MRQKGTVLLVDDDAAFIETNRQILENHGYRVAEAHNGKECVAQARSLHPDAIVLDVMMDTKAEGITVTYKLRTSDETRTIPILMVTAVFDSLPLLHEPDEFWREIDVFLEKPVEPEKLLEWVDKTVKPTPHVPMGRTNGTSRAPLAKA